MNRIKLERRLSPALDRDERAAHDGEVASFPLTPWGLLKAARSYDATREADVQRWGNIGAGSLTLTCRGRDVTDEIRNAAANGSRPWLDSLLADLKG